MHVMPCSETRDNLHVLPGAAKCTVAHPHWEYDAAFPKTVAALNGQQKELQSTVNNRSKSNSVQLVCHCAGDQVYVNVQTRSGSACDMPLTMVASREDLGAAG